MLTLMIKIVIYNVRFVKVVTKAHVDQLRNDDERARIGLRIDFSNESTNLMKNKQNNDFSDHILTKLNSITVNRSPTSDSELSNKTY